MPERPPGPGNWKRRARRRRAREPGGPVAAVGPQPAWRAAGTPEEGMTGARGCAVTAAFPGGKNVPPRVQAVAEPGKMRVSMRWRWDLNPRAGEISPIGDMNPKTSEKSPGSGISCVHHSWRPTARVKRLPPSAVSDSRATQVPEGSPARGCPVFCLVQQSDGPYPESRPTGAPGTPAPRPARPNFSTSKAVTFSDALRHAAATGTPC